MKKAFEIYLSYRAEKSFFFFLLIETNQQVFLIVVSKSTACNEAPVHVLRLTN